LCVSPAESNGNMKIYDKYQYSDPTGAVTPKQAQWDPAFKAVKGEVANFSGSTATDPGGVSYAYMPPIGNRRPKWSNTFNATEAIVGNRGPSYQGTGSGATLTWSLVQTAGSPVEGAAEIGTGSN